MDPWSRPLGTHGTQRAFQCAWFSSRCHLTTGIRQLSCSSLYYSLSLSCLSCSRIHPSRSSGSRSNQQPSSKQQAQAHAPPGISICRATKTLPGDCSAKHLATCAPGCRTVLPCWPLLLPTQVSERAGSFCSRCPPPFGPCSPSCSLLFLWLCTGRTLGPRCDTVASGRLCDISVCTALPASAACISSSNDCCCCYGVTHARSISTIQQVLLRQSHTHHAISLSSPRPPVCACPPLFAPFSPCPHACTPH